MIHTKTNKRVNNNVKKGISNIKEYSNLLYIWLYMYNRKCLNQRMWCITDKII